MQSNFQKKSADQIYLEFGDEFSEGTPKAQSKKGQTQKLNLLKLRQIRDWEKICTEQDLMEILYPKPTKNS